MTPTETYMIAYLVHRGKEVPMMDELMGDSFLEMCDDVCREFSEKLYEAYREVKKKEDDWKSLKEALKEAHE
ncbi:MAG: hypothetical protein ACXABY_23445 [Candidatus Thorarchaeota archaeon]